MGTPEQSPFITEEHQFLRETVRNFTREHVEPQAEHYDRVEQFNQELFRKLGPLGFLGVTVPEAYGGSGMDALAAVIIHEELSRSDPGLCLAYLAHSMLCANNLAVNASEDQKKALLPKLCSGEWIGAMGMSEPGAGTDVLAMQTSVRQEKNEFVINGRKLWITNGVIDEERTPCDVILLYAKNQPDESGQKVQISSFIVQKGDPGFSVGQKIEGKTGMRASNTAELCFDDCRVSSEAMVGKKGESLVHMMRNLEIERVTLAAMSLGIAQRCLDVMVRYANERKAFGTTLSSHGQIQAYIGDSFAELGAMRAYIYSTASQLSLEKSGQRLDSDGVKLFAAPAAKRIADRAIQVLGGYGYVSEYVVERLWRDAKLLEIGGGTLEAHQKNITKELSRQL